MPLGGIWRDFLITADNTDVLSGDILMGSLGPGWYTITILSAAAADGSLTVSDGQQNVLSGVSIPVRAAAVTFPEIKKNEDRYWSWRYIGADHPTINVNDGTNCEIALRVTYWGKKAPAAF